MSTKSGVEHLARHPGWKSKARMPLPARRVYGFLTTLMNDEPWTMRDVENAMAELRKLGSLMAADEPQGDITDGWKLKKQPDGYYEARYKRRPPHYHNLGNGRTELSAWVDLRERLESTRE